MFGEVSPYRRAQEADEGEVMTMTAKGVAKLVEECGELQQILGKRLAYWHTEQHPDGKNATISDRMAEEMGDVMAAIIFTADQFGIGPIVQSRCHQKLRRFEEWEALADNNSDAIDGRLR
jgi:NTP pyrophosphatase (non-canonical NTP hydrolase)